jgi:hypothetical protein
MEKLVETHGLRDFSRIAGFQNLTPRGAGTRCGFQIGGIHD